MKKSISSVFTVLVLAGLAWFFWQWGFCRFYVKPGFMAVVTAKTGRNLEPGQILARPGQKGVREDVLGEGRHFLNPVLFDVEIIPLVSIPVGKSASSPPRWARNCRPVNFWPRPARRAFGGM